MGYLVCLFNNILLKCLYEQEFHLKPTGPRGERELTSCCESVLNLQSGERGVPWDDVFFDMVLDVLFYVVWAGCVGVGMDLFSWLGCLRWGCEGGLGEASM